MAAALNVMNEQTQQNKSRLWTVEETAGYWRVHVETVRRLIRNRKIEFIAVGRDYRIPQEQVMKGLPDAVA